MTKDEYVEIKRQKCYFCSNSEEQLDKLVKPSNQIINENNREKSQFYGISQSTNTKKKEDQQNKNKSN